MKTAPELKRKGIGGHQRGFTGQTVEWLTPPEIVKAVGPFDLDPCTPPNMPWRTATVMLSAPADGLAEEWFGAVWLNPPYGPDTGKWLVGVSVADLLQQHHDFLEHAGVSHLLVVRLAGVPLHTDGAVAFHHRAPSVAERSRAEQHRPLSDFPTQYPTLTGRTDRHRPTDGWD